MTTFHFECQDCGQEMAVNDAVRDGILEHGCPLCGTAVTETEFGIPST